MVRVSEHFPTHSPQRLRIRALLHGTNGFVLDNPSETQAAGLAWEVEPSVHRQVSLPSTSKSLLRGTLGFGRLGRGDFLALEAGVGAVFEPSVPAQRDQTW